ncbi:MAG TPA: endopeptidase La, partial [Gemmataceae bacterium]|nr:endopeptidase La [Gemmataceae bacterium]
MTLESRPDPTPQPAPPPTTGPAAHDGGPRIILPPPAGLLPVLPLKNTILFPYLFLPLNVGRPNSVAAVEAALAREDKTLLIVAQRDASTDDLNPENLYAVGTRAVIKKMNRGDEGLEILVQGLDRIRLTAFDQVEPFLLARFEGLPLPEDEGPEIEALQRAVMEQAGKAVELAQPQQGPANILQMLAAAGNPLRLAYLLASMLGLDVAKEQELLEAPTRMEALRLIHGYLAHEVQVLELRRHIASQAQTEMTKEQRQYVLRQQMRAIQDELGETNPEKADIQTLREKLDQADLPDEIRKETERELGRLERLPPQAPDHQVTRTYLELVAELPWRKGTPDVLDLDRARQVLDEDHYGLKDIKERILEHLAVLKLNPQANAPILCFVGPPGVGKTSLGQSIARAIGRKFERLSLGGMHDESELRGHRRTYIGSMPGRIIQGFRRAGVNNPLLMLDEVDKLGRDFRGDPASALLEILDPAQNHTFRDNYLDLPFDLSKVLFITTANDLAPVPRPLLDRMEVLRLTGYSDREKLEIAKRYLVPRSRTDIGLTDQQVTIADETLTKVIEGYTREAGVRQLGRAIGRLMRKVAVRFAEGKTDPVTIDPDDLTEMLGPEQARPEQARRDLPAGVATGMAWTESGGEVLYVEANLLPHSRKLRITGQLGKVMRESARAAQSYVWAHADQLGIDPSLFRTNGVHIHVPAGAVPKDGPSAGVALVTALASLYTGVPARSDTAMTGEITLSGLVLPIGGVKEKVLGARRAGINRVILPKANEKDLRDLPEGVRREVEVTFADTIDEVLAAALPDREPAMA